MEGIKIKVTVKRIGAYLEELAPKSIALQGDPVGLQLGNPDAGVDKALVALDPDGATVEEAAKLGANLLVTHHPLFYHRLSSIDESLPAGALVARAIRDGLSIYCAHTNYDTAPGGVSYRLAEALGFPVEGSTVLEVTGSEQLLKLVVFVPCGHEDLVRDALAVAGAGHIGNYSHCTFQVSGTGTFKAGDSANPFLGSRGQLERVDEYRLETILPATRRSTVVKALIDAHPYEEVAYDLYPLNIEGRAIGLGLLLELTEPCRFEDLVSLCRDRLHAPSLRVRSFGKKEISRLAICGGSGGSLIEHAVRGGADILVSGDFRYHDFKLAEACGLSLIDAGHAATEYPGVVYLQEFLKKRLREEGYDTAVLLRQAEALEWS